MCVGAHSGTRQQTRFSEVSANPGVGNQNTSCPGKGVWVACLQRKPSKSNVPRGDGRGKRFPSSESGETSRQKNPLIFSLTDVIEYPFVFPVISDKIPRDPGTQNRHGQRPQHLGLPGGWRGPLSMALDQAFLPAPLSVQEGAGRTQTVWIYTDISHFLSRIPVLRLASPNFISQKD